MKKFVIATLLAGILALVTGCSSQKPAPTPATTPQVQPSTQNATTPNQTSTPSSTTTTVGSGKDVYDKNCASCHGAAGAGGMGPGLTTEKRTQAQVADVTKKGKGKMPAYAGTLSDTEIQAVAQYVADFKK